jgi:hypothetical protein
MKAYFEEWFGLMTVAILVSVFVIGFKPLFKVFVSTVPMPDGMREAAAA